MTKFSPFTEANTREFLELKLYNRNLQASASEIQKVLRKVDLESHGYMKEVTTKLVKEPGSDKTIYQVCHYCMWTYVLHVAAVCGA